MALGFGRETYCLMCGNVRYNVPIATPRREDALRRSRIDGEMTKRLKRPSTRCVI